MAVENIPDEFELQATAFVLGELDANAASEFEEQVSKSAEKAKVVESIREAVLAIEDELNTVTNAVTATDRERIEQAIEAVPSSNHVQLSAVEATEPTSNRRLLIVGLSVAACVLVIFGLNQYARLNQAQVALRSQPPVEEDVMVEMSMDEFASAAPTMQSPSRPQIDSEVAAPDDELLSVMEAAIPESSEPAARGGRAPVDDSTRSRAARETTEGKSLMRTARSSSSPEQSQERSMILAAPDPPAAVASREEELAVAPKPNSRAQANAAPPLPPSGPEMMGMGGYSDAMGEIDGEAMGVDGYGEMMGGMGGGGMGGGGGGAMLGVTPRIIISSKEESALGGRGLVLTERYRNRISKNQDRYAPLQDNEFESAAREPLSTFSIDVDTASYTKVRMDLMQFNRRPNPDAVRIEEMINYFEYNYPKPHGEHPFAAAMEVASCPWNPKHRLARIGIQGKVIDQQRPASNLVFLLDVSGSMNRPNKLPLVISGMRMLVNQLGENDSVAIVVYAGAAGLVLDATQGDRKKRIYDSLDLLRAGGSTNGGEGIQLAYEVARQNFIRGGINRVILCSDGDFNVGLTGTDELVTLAEQNAKDNIFLSVFGFGTGNHNDAMMEQISNKANGNYAFIDTEDEARRVFVDQMQGTLVTIAKDVKIQVEFNPAEVASYRLIGYANRMLAAKDFNDDTKDAGEIGAGHRVTALYEIVPAGDEDQVSATDEEADTAAKPEVDSLRYQKPVRLSDKAGDGELLTLKLRYKLPEEDTSRLITMPIRDGGKTIEAVDRDFKFAVAVAGFGMLLRNSEHLGQTTFDLIEKLAEQGADGDVSGYRSEFLEMIRKAKATR
ncbi:MAG: von Willebrand factor type A domain-containing protein [Planctomycetota bacterium]